MEIQRASQKNGFLQQSNRYAVNLTVRELVAFGRYPYNRGRQSAADDRIINDSLAKLSLTEYANQSIHELLVVSYNEFTWR